jgi:uncharacterized membrane protein YdjX (TVP38/TMEM64 family)
MTSNGDEPAPGGRTPRGAVKRLLPVALIAAAMALVFAMGWHRQLSLETLIAHRSTLERLVAAQLPAALGGYMATYILAVALSVPGAVFLTIAGGILFGVWMGSAAAIVSATIGASLIFLVASSAFGGVIMRRAGPIAAKVAEGFRSDAFSYLLFLRLVPVFPFWLVNIAAALVGVRFVTFVAATAIGIIPGTVAFAFLGAGFDSVIAAQAEAFDSCKAAGRLDCRRDFDVTAALTPQLVAALVALGLVALLPVAVKRLRGRPAAPSSE